MSTIRNKTRKSNPPSRNKTRKSNVPSRNNAIKAMYNKDYYGTELLPITDILNYAINNFDEFVIYKEKNLLNISKREMEKIRGKNITTIFQEPMSSLNPLHTIEKQINERIFYEYKFFYN